MEHHHISFTVVILVSTTIDKQLDQHQIENPPKSNKIIYDNNITLRLPHPQIIPKILVPKHLFRFIIISVDICM